MPARRSQAVWRAAIDHARTLPDDGVSLWVCRGGHRYVVVGVFVEFQGIHLVRVSEYNQAGRGRELVCGCGERPAQRIPQDRARVRAARALFLIGGIEAVRQFFQGHPPPDGATSGVRAAGWLPLVNRDRFNRTDSFQAMCEIALPVTAHKEVPRVPAPELDRGPGV